MNIDPQRVMKVYSENEVEDLLKKAIRMAREEDFVPYTNGETAPTYSETDIIDSLLARGLEVEGYSQSQKR